MARVIRKESTFNKHVKTDGFMLLSETDYSILYRVGERIYWYKKEN